MSQPNIIFIMTDTQATNMVGCYTGLPLNTQHIDALAAKSVKFDAAWTTCPLCTPARAGLFTGIYANQSGPWTNNIAPGKNMRTMGSYFKAAGWHTGFIGKWHLDGHDYFGTGICPDEWDARYWYDGANYLSDLSEQQISLWRNGLNTRQDLDAYGIDDEFTWAWHISERAIQFIHSARAEPETPFLLVLSYDEPHHPFTCPSRYVENYENFSYPLGNKARDTLADKPTHQRLWAQAMPSPVTDEKHYVHPLYFACNDFVDDQIGRVLDSLTADEWDNTWIVYTSDHGEMMGAHRLISKGSAAYDDICRIPLLIHAPGRKAAVREQPVSHLDLLPTLLDVAGLSVPDALQGRSLLPLLTAPDRWPERGVMVEFNRYEIEHDSFGGFIPMRAWVTAEYKLVINLFDEDELYDRVRDPEEMVNLIHYEEYHERRDRLHDALLAYMDRIRDPFRGYQWATREWRPDLKPQWMGAFRPKPADGVSPVVRDYDTGLPTKGTKVETKQQKF
ncbi:sulfatase-like hydrolase/transferase [Sodalis sp. dw_96]|uniref:sulfatase-like hydrolase/transferase n=1 Tax=Sodalis sp. dw_96 TaxID=2719794 RepID=UPI001BD54A87|nr:sulfatase-like hydrolase/transferase [Sodalis sp. dw_96]